MNPMPDHNFWIVVAIIAGAFLLWRVADFFIGKIAFKCIRVDMEAGRDNDER